MTLKKFYIGTHGPFYYNDEDLIDDPDGDFTDQYRAGFVTDGPVRVGSAPVESEDVLRLTDFETIYVASDILTKLKTVDGTGSGLDADLLDGYHGSTFAIRSEVNGTFTTVDGKTVTVNAGVVTGIV